MTEIDLPGHTNAALASYPELNPDGRARDLYTGIEVGFSSLAIHKQITYEFVEEVLGELAAITPGAFIHIGGDEAKSTSPEDYLHFVGRLQAILQGTGKSLIGWQEISKARLKPGSLLQYWDERLSFRPPATQVIMSPASNAYLDMKYDESSPLGLDWAGTISVSHAYDWDPATLLPSLPDSSIVGIESPLWTETIRTQKDMEYMLFPRLPGYAEIGWSAQVNRKWDDFRQRLAQHAERWIRNGMNAYRSPQLTD